MMILNGARDHGQVVVEMLPQNSVSRFVRVAGGVSEISVRSASNSVSGIGAAHLAKRLLHYLLLGR